jgi:hypothetical protein
VELGRIKGDIGWREMLERGFFEPQGLQRQIEYAQDGVGSIQSQLAYDHCTAIIIVVLDLAPVKGRRSPRKSFWR